MAFVSCSYAAATYQPKLKDCNGADLPAGTEMATCADLAGLSIPDATDTTKGKVALNAGTSLPDDATNCTDALTACGLNALLTDPAAGGNAVINGIKALIPAASSTVAGITRFATNDETALPSAPSNTTTAVTPDDLSYTLQRGRNYLIDVRVAGGQVPVGIRGQSAGGTVAGAGVIGALTDTTSTSGNPTYFSGVSAAVQATVTTPAGLVTSGLNAQNESVGAGTKYGTYSVSQGTGGGTNIGVYGQANNGTTNWAGYFDGNTFTSGTATIGSNSQAQIKTFGANEAWLTYLNDSGSGSIGPRSGSGSNGAFITTYGATNTSTGNPGGIDIRTDTPGTGEVRLLGVSRLVSGGSVTAPSFITSSDSTLKENVEDIDAAKALQFRNGLQWKKYELFSEQQVEIMEEVTEEVQKTDAAGNPVVDADGNPVMETVTKQVGTGRYEVKRNSQGIKRGLIAQEVQALAQSIGDFSDVVVEVGEYFTLDAQGYPVKDAQGNNIVNKRLGIDYDAVQFIICAGEQSLLPAVV